MDREAEAIKLDGLSVAEVKQLRDSAEKHAFQAEVNRMMKLIINSLYKNKEVFLRELISNASDALDKIRLLSPTDKSVLDATEELTIKIKVDKDNKVLHITDTGIGMTKEDLINNLGTIAKSGTSEFLGKLQDAASAGEMSDIIGQFGVGFYSAFLVAVKVVVTSRNNDGSQHIWESDAESFSVVENHMGPTLKRGTQISLYLKEEAHDFLEQDTVLLLLTALFPPSGMNITFIRGLHSDYMFIDLRKALCDNDGSVRKAAAQTFDSLHTVVGSRALDDILPAMLEQLGDPDMHENALDGLRQIMAIKSRAVLPYLIPQLTASPVNTKALSILASVAGESLNKHLAKILPALLSSLAESHGTPDETVELGYARAVVLSVQDETGKF